MFKRPDLEPQPCHILALQMGHYFTCPFLSSLAINGREDELTSQGTEGLNDLMSMLMQTRGTILFILNLGYDGRLERTLCLSKAY